MSKTAWQYSRKIIGKIKLNPNAKLALTILAYRHQDAVSEDAYLRVAMRDLAAHMNVPLRQVQRSISELVDKGVIIVVNDHKRHRRAARTYRFPADFDVPGLRS